jgi:hypothetical protein
MYTIRHNYKYIPVQYADNDWAKRPNFPPQSAQSIQPHFTIYYVTKQTPSVMSADGNEIRSGLSVIIITQADRLPMVLIRIVLHVLMAAL